MYQYFSTQQDKVFFQGQVREIPKPEHWDKLVYGDPRDLKYQNGGTSSTKTTTQYNL
eukprot:m.140556 g.140556  ORF g.140556 m.140556 type:complete len:57 (-) comp14829_c0_seq6:13-183(-)